MMMGNVFYRVRGVKKIIHSIFCKILYTGLPSKEETVKTTGKLLNYDDSKIEFSLVAYNTISMAYLKGVFAKNERGYRLTR